MSASKRFMESLGRYNINQKNKAGFLSQIFDLNNKKWKDAMRYPRDLSPRTIPRPNIKPGVAHKLSQNEYFKRDDRRAIEPPVVYTNKDGQQNLLQSPDADSASLMEALPPTPGIGFTWNKGQSYKNF
eukprot:Clim_evm12s222 gene=Clim_evmTU12s222